MISEPPLTKEGQFFRISAALVEENKEKVLTINPKRSNCKTSLEPSLTRFTVHKLLWKVITFKPW